MYIGCQYSGRYVQEMAPLIYYRLSQFQPTWWLSFWVTASLYLRLSRWNHVDASSTSPSPWPSQSHKLPVRAWSTSTQARHLPYVFSAPSLVSPLQYTCSTSLLCSCAGFSVCMCIGTGEGGIWCSNRLFLVSCPGMLVSCVIKFPRF